MYKEIALFTLLAATACPQSAPTPRPAQSQSAAATELPKGAIPNKDGGWSWTDKDGKKWTYRKTEFGYSRAPVAGQVTRPPGIPADAVPAANGTYIWTDKNGKKWTYSTNLFGVTRVPWTEAAPPKNVKDDTVKAIDNGDTVRFERKGPFGTSVWEKKKTEMNADERKIYDSRKADTQTK